MGWNPFSGKDKLYVASEIVNLVQDTPNIVSQSILKSTLRNSDKTADLMDTLLGSLGVKGDQYHEYGRLTYTNGLPKGTVGQYRVDIKVLVNFLEKQYPLSDTNLTYEIASFVIDVFDIQEFMKYRRISNAQYVSYKFIGTNIVAITFKKINTIHPDETYVINYSTDYPLNHTNSYYYLSFEQKDKTTGNILPNTTQYVIYWEDDPRYPELRPVNPDTPFTQFMPIVPLRINGVSYTDDSRKNTDLYKTSKILLSKVNLKIENLDKGINQNPNIANVDHAYVTLGVNVKSDKPASKEYMYQFFKDLSYRSTATKADLTAWLKKPDRWNLLSPPCNVIKIEDQTYKTYIWYYYIEYDFYDVVIGDVGTIKTYSQYYGWITMLYGAGSRPNENNVLLIQKQISPTQIEEVRVYGLFFSNEIYSVGQAVINNIDFSDDTGQQVLIPLNLSIVQSLSTLQATELYYDSLQAVFNAYEWVHIKWYQTSAFKVLVVIAMVAIAIFSGGAGAFIDGLIGAITAGVVATAVFISEAILINLAIAYTFKFAVQKLGVKTSLTIALLLAVTASVAGMMPTDFPIATDLMNYGFEAVEYLSKAISEVTEELFEQLSQGFALTSKEEKEELDKINKIEKELAVKNQDVIQEVYATFGMLPNENIIDYAGRISESTNYINEAVNYVWDYTDIMYDTDFGTNINGEYY